MWRSLGAVGESWSTLAGGKFISSRRRVRLRDVKILSATRRKSTRKSSALPLRQEKLHNFCVKRAGLSFFFPRRLQLISRIPAVQVKET